MKLIFLLKVVTSGVPIYSVVRTSIKQLIKIDAQVKEDVQYFSTEVLS